MPLIAGVVVAVVVIVIIAGMALVLTDDDDDGSGGTEATVKTLNLNAEVFVSSYWTNLTIEHRGDDPITWSDYQVRLDSEILSSPTDQYGYGDPQSERGETVYFRAYDTYLVGEDYTVKVTELESDHLVWEKTVTAKSE